MPPKVAPKTPKPLPDDVVQALKDLIDQLREELVSLIDEKMSKPMSASHCASVPTHHSGSL